MTLPSADVVVIGAGLAGLSAALEAREAGATVRVLERAPLAERGGNTRFSNGAMRAVYSGIEDIDELVGGLSNSERARADFGSYTREEYIDDMGRITQYRTDPELAELLINRSAETMTWLHNHGVGFLPLYEWHPAMPDGRIKFSGGSALETRGGGDGLSEALFAAVERAGIAVVYETRATGLVMNDGVVTGVRAKTKGKPFDIAAKRVILACGGFEANTEWRTRYLGTSWELAKVRGSRFNTGDGLRIALDIGAAPFGNWSGCHSASWDLNAPDVNELAYGTVFKRDDYMYGLIVNSNGERFVDEGEDVRAVTYAKLGRVILTQPGQVAWQIYDAKVAHLIHGEYRTRRAARFVADTLPALVHKLEGVKHDRLLHTIAEYNRAVPPSPPFDASTKDGREDRRPRDSEIELGPNRRYTAVRSLRRHLRHHVHLRRAEDRRRLSRHRRRRRRDSRPLRGRRNRRRDFLFQLSGRLRADVSRRIWTHCRCVRRAGRLIFPAGVK